MSKSDAAAKIPERAKKYIVSHYVFAEHGSWADAEAERQRLQKKFPHQKMRVYCILEKFENYEDMNIKGGKVIHAKG